MKKKKLVFLWRKLNSLELGKDVMLIPYYLGKYLDYDVEICVGYSNEQESLVDKYQKRTQVQINRKPLTYNPIQRMFIYFLYLITHAKKIDLLMCFHWRMETYFNILLYKFINPKGKVYIKLDSTNGKEFDINRFKGFEKSFKKKLYQSCLNKVTVMSCETSDSYQTILQTPYFAEQIKKKLLLIPNAFDEEYFKELNLKEYAFEEKENIIVSIGRIGSKQKNSEMLLNAVNQIDLRNWKVYFIGPIEKEFQEKIVHYQKENIIFTGPIYNKKDLWQWLNKAKVFVLTSRWESYGLVLIEAQRFRNYILSTSVGAAKDIIGDNNYGEIIEQENSTQLASVLKRIISGETNIHNFFDNTYKDISYSKVIEPLTYQLRKQD